MVVCVVFGNVIGQVVILFLVILFKDCIKVVVISIGGVLEYLGKVVKVLVWLNKVDCSSGDSVVN